MKICVLQPDYSTSEVDYQNYDPPRDLAQLMPEASFVHVLLNKLTTYKQLKELSKQHFDIYVNLCEGYLEWEVPSIDVVYTLELLHLPFTGPTTFLYDPPKKLMKYVAYTEGIKTPAYAIIEQEENIEADCKHLKFPLFVKPAKAGDSLGIDDKSLVHNVEELQQKVKMIIDAYAPILVEEYIDGREFTVMLAANADGKAVMVFKPVEYIFPEGNTFKTHTLKTSELHPNANIPCNDDALEEELKKAAAQIFKSFNGVGYARLDFRVNDKKEVYFLEINFTCSVFYKDGYEGSADYILKHDGYGQANFLKHIIHEGIYRHKQKQKKYSIKGNAIAGYGIYANREIKPNEVIFCGEGMAQRIITKRFVEENWNEQDKESFARYAYPISDEVYLLWDKDPAEWAPQNHSCNANTGYNGLNVLSLRNIHAGEELTLNYVAFLNETMQPFNCNCGAPNCIGTITGAEKNSITEREKRKHQQQ
ncbi:MAG: ATP-grasp domain-containing protein [Ferruginibacter sp.]